MADDDVFRSLLARRIGAYRAEEEELERRIAEWQQQKDSLTDRREQAEALYESEFGEFSPDLGEDVQLALTLAAHRGGPLTGLTWADAITHVLREADQPLHVKELWDRLSAGGFDSDSRDPLRSLVSVMVRRPEFIKVGPNTYGLRAVERPHARGGVA